jgi:hypothetical protein
VRQLQENNQPYLVGADRKQCAIVFGVAVRLKLFTTQLQHYWLSDAMRIRGGETAVMNAGIDITMGSAFTWDILRLVGRTAASSCANKHFFVVCCKQSRDAAGLGVLIPLIVRMVKSTKLVEKCCLL